MNAAQPRQLPWQCRVLLPELRVSPLDGGYTLVACHPYAVRQAAHCWLCAAYRALHAGVACGSRRTDGEAKSVHDVLFVRCGILPPEIARNACAVRLIRMWEEAEKNK